MIKGFTSEQKLGDQNYVTLQPLGSGKYGIDILPKYLAPVSLSPFVVDSSTVDTIVVTGIHTSARIGDVVRVLDGSQDRIEVTVIRVETNTLYIGNRLSSALLAGVQFILLRPISLTLNSNGEISVSSGPVQYVLDGSPQQVVEDTVNSANNRPLPIKLKSSDVDLASSAKQDSAILQLQAILAKIIAAPATEAKQDTIISAINSLVSLNEVRSVIASAYAASPTIPTATRYNTSVSVPVLKTGLELEILVKAGDNFTAYDAASGGNVLGRFTQAGGKIPVNLPAGTSIYLQSDTGLAFTATDLTINLIGV